MINQADVLRGHMEHIGGCGDGGCIVHVRPGMHTNGGCGCNRNPHTMFQVVHWHKRAVAAQAAQIEQLREAVKRLLAWCESEAGNGSNLSDEQVEDELESIELARAALQPKEGE